jgi:hypothetical protein
VKDSSAADDLNRGFIQTIKPDRCCRSAWGALSAAPNLSTGGGIVVHQADGLAGIGGRERRGNSGGACADDGDVESEMFDAIHRLLFPYSIRKAPGNCGAAVLR